MTRDDITRMAREAGLLRSGDGWTEPHRWGKAEIEKFAALIEQHLYYDGLHSCHSECQRPACVRFRNAVNEAVKAEREACAQVCEGHYDTAKAARAIRARGEK